jgi:hypothetical protein
VLSNLQASQYEVTFRLDGFKTTTVRVRVTVGAAVTLNAALALGGISESVSVSTSPERINTRTAEVSTTIEERPLATLPTLTRNPYDFVALSGNVSLDDQVTPVRGAQGYAINGQRASSSNVLLDGASNNDEFTASIGQAVPLDAVQEFSVITSNFSAQYGRATGGVVNLITKAGSNEFHGTADYFFRNDSMTSQTVDQESRGMAKNPFSRHQPSFSFGGPVRRNVAQFFVAGEYIYVRSTKTDIGWVPASGFLARSAPATQQYFAAFPRNGTSNGTVYTRARFQSEPGSPLLTLPADTPILEQVQYGVPADVGAGSPQNTLALVSRLDWTMGSASHAYIRYALRDQELLAGTNSYSPYQGFNTGSVAHQHNLLFSLTHVWTPAITSQSKVVFSRLRSDQPLGDQGVVPGLYVLSGLPATLDGIHVALPGYLPFAPGTAIPFGGPQTQLQILPDQTVFKGGHDLRLGGSFVRIEDDRTFGAYQESVMTLGSNVSNGMDNLMRGLLHQFEGAVDPQGKFPGQVILLPVEPPDFTRRNRYNEFALYANDSWAASPRLTVSMGVRYEYYGVQHNADPSLDSNFYDGPGASQPAQIRSGSVQRAPDSPVGGLWAPDANNVAPRVGFAWNVDGSGRTSVRGGYGIAYERNFGNVTFNVIQNPPAYAVVALVAGTDVPSIPISLDNAGPLAGTGSTPLPQVSLRQVDPHIRNASAHFWSASFQREFTAASTVVSVDYTGSKGVDLYMINRLNGPGSGAVYLGDASPTSRENAQYGTINTRTNGGRSLYNGVTFGVDERNIARTGLSLTGRYTLSHAQDELSTTFSESNNNFNLGVLDPYHPELDWGDAAFDIRHRFVASAIWDIPGPSAGFMGRIASGWQASGIFVAQSGLPFTVYDCSHASLTCNRLIAVAPLPSPSAVPTGDPNTYVYLDLRSQQAGVGSYVNAVTGTSDFGPYPVDMTARNVFRAPGRWNLDLAFAKRIEIKGSHALQLRLELYNPLQHANLYVDTSTADVRSNMVITAVRGATSTLGVAGDGQRRFQIACKYEF